MAVYEPRDMSGTLFPEQNKKSERAPDYTGNIMFNGTQYRLAAWTKHGKRGDFLSLKVSEMEGERRRRDDDSESF